MAVFNVANAKAALENKFLVIRDAVETLTGLKTFDLGVNPPFAVVAGAGKVTNLDADKLDNQDGAFYQNAGNLNAGTIPDARIPNPLPAVSGENLTSLQVTKMSGLRAFGGRLTLETGVPVSTTDQTAKTTVYYTPYIHNVLSLYSGSAWVPFTFSELSLSLSGLTANLPYDIFVYDNAGVRTLEAVAWTNSTTRATAIVRQDGTYVKSGTLTKAYLGTICITGTTGQCEDSKVKRFVWNYYNRVGVDMLRQETTASWTYSLAVTRQANASTANQLEIVCGVAEDEIDVFASVITSNTSASYWAIGIGEDSITAFLGGVLSGQGRWIANEQTPSTVARLVKRPAIGKHYYAWLENHTSATGTQTWYGTGSVVGVNGIHARWRA
jgi:hypothetical protein